MNTKHKTILLVVAFVILLIIGISSGLKERYRLAPECSEILDYELIWIGPMGMLSAANIDSVTPKNCSLEMSNGWIRDLIFGKPQIVAGDPGLITASNHSNALTLRYYIQGNPTSGYPLVIQENGAILKCPENEHTPYGNGRSWLLSNSQILTIDHSFGTNKHRVIVFDMQSCIEIDEIYVSEWDEGVGDSVPSVQGWLAIQLHTSHTNEIVVWDADRNEMLVIPDGRYPAWSRDGEWLAYTISDELYIVPKDDYSPIKVGQIEGLSYASWSPDGTKLLYGGYVENHPITRIVDVKTQNETILPLYKPVMAATWR